MDKTNCDKYIRIIHQDVPDKYFNENYLQHLGG